MKETHVLSFKEVTEMMEDLGIFQLWMYFSGTVSMKLFFLRQFLWNGFSHMTRASASHIIYFTLFAASSFLKLWHLASSYSPFQDHSNNKQLTSVPFWGGAGGEGKLLLLGRFIERNHPVCAEPGHHPKPMIAMNWNKPNMKWMLGSLKKGQSEQIYSSKI